MGNPELETLLAEQSEHWQLRYEPQVETTMELARELLAEVDESRPGLAYTSLQTHGKGQQGRVWEQTEGGLTMTLVFATALQANTLLGFSLVAGCAVHEVAQHHGAAIRLKWPNDILSVVGDKIGGILVEVVSKNDLHYVLTGIGINVSKVPALSSTASLRDAGASAQLTPERLAVDIASTLHRSWQQFLTDGFAPFQDTWNAAAFGRGEIMRVTRDNKELEGTFEGVDAEGFLLVNGAKGRERLVSGTIQNIGDKSYASRF